MELVCGVRFFFSFFSHSHWGWWPLRCMQILAPTLVFLNAYLRTCSYEVTLTFLIFFTFCEVHLRQQHSHWCILTVSTHHQVTSSYPQ
ncbi:hypothetical protein SETIT_8G043900v2, partial [Setaria italica]